jgi:hypothetical protein
MIHVWETQHEINQNEFLRGILHLRQSLDLDQDVLIPVLSVFVTPLASKDVVLAVLRPVKDALAERGEVVADYADLGFKMRIDLDPWEAQDEVVGCAVEAVRTLGFDLQQRPTGRRRGRVTRPEFNQFLREASHLMMLARSLEDGYITSDRDLPHVMFSDPTSTMAVMKVGSWCSSYPQKYGALLQALTTGLMLRRSWEEEAP